MYMGAGANETGFHFLLRQDALSPHANNTTTNNSSYKNRIWGHPTLPCSSEGSDKLHCRSSTFDKIVELSKASTKSCDIVLYTDLLGNDIDVDGKVVTAPMLSMLVEKLVGDTTYESMIKIGIAHPKKDSMDIDHKLDLLNGNLVYRGWMLHFVDTGVKVIYPDERSLLKLSPGRFFHPSVKLAMSLSRDFPIDPTLDDVRFTTALMNRHTAREGEGQRSHHQHFTDPNGGREVTYTVGKSNRRAVLLLPGLKGF